MEIWKPIIGFEGLYEVSNLGKIKSLNYRNTKNECIMRSGNRNKYGHGTIILSKNSTVYSKSLHRLVGIHFISNPLNLPCVLHKDETLDENGSLCNWADNLYWGTHKDNTNDMYKKGRENNHFYTNNPRPTKGKFGKDNPTSKAINQYSLDGIFIKTWDSLSDVERELGISCSGISKCCKGKYKHAGGFIWRF